MSRSVLYCLIQPRLFAATRRTVYLVFYSLSILFLSFLPSLFHRNPQAFSRSPRATKTAANYTIPGGLSMRKSIRMEKVSRNFHPILENTLHTLDRKENRLHFINENRNMAIRRIRLRFQMRQARKILLQDYTR
jgi:hypothetical protein